MARATLAAKFCTTRFVILCDNGVFSCNALITDGTASRTFWTLSIFLNPTLAFAKAAGSLRSFLRSAAASLGSSAATIALTKAIPSSPFEADRD